MNIRYPICQAAIITLFLSLVTLTNYADIPPKLKFPDFPPVFSPTEIPDPKIVQEKIALLGLRDYTLPSQEKPKYWLWTRRKMIIPELTRGLNEKEKRIAEGCLKILETIPNHPEIVDSLVRIARDQQHMIYREITLSLSLFPRNVQVRDVQVQEIMVQALAGDRFTDPRERSWIAEAAGRKEEAAKYLISLLKTNKYDSQCDRDINKLGNIGHRVAINPLVKITKAQDWRYAVGAYRALAKIDPQQHGLTNDQREFINRSAGTYWENREAYGKRCKILAQLNKNEIRPFVLHMMKTNNSSTALTILQEWNDRGALPEIKSYILSERGLRLGEFVMAYLQIEGFEKSIDDIKTMFTMRNTEGSMSADDFENIIRSIYRSDMSQVRKLQYLQSFREYFGDKYAYIFPRNIREHQGEREILLKGLMQREISLNALVPYAKIAARSKQNLYAKEVTRVLNRLIQNESDPSSILEILDAGSLAETGQMANKYLVASDLSNRLLAAHLAATRGGDREKALKILYETLTNENFANPQKKLYLELSAKYLNSVNCRDDKEKQECEELLLQQLEKTTQNYAMSILPTCSGEMTAKKLLPFLDNEDVKRAVYAAWVLAQNPDDKILQQGLRRLEIYLLFHHTYFMTGAGGDFSIDRNVKFRQVPENMYHHLEPPPIHKTIFMKDMESLRLFELNEQEQEFSIRAYRYCRLKNMSQIWFSFGHYFAEPNTWNASYLPLLRVIALEDSYLTFIYVQGQKVPYFPNRRKAAQAIAKLTGQKTAYIDIAGDEMDSEAVPKPYKNQNDLIAGYILDLIEQGNIFGPPESDTYKFRRAIYENQIHRLIGDSGRGEFENELMQVLILESEKRGMKDKLTQANFSIWR